MSSLKAAFVCVFVVVVLGDIPRKQLGGPPSEFEKHRLPVPVSAGVNQYSALLSAPLNRDENRALSGSLALPVDSASKFAFTVYSDILDHLDLKLTAPNGKRVWLWLHEFKSGFPLSDDDAVHVPAKTFVFFWPFIQLGIYQLTVTSKTDAPESVLEAGTPNVLVNLFNYDGVRVFSYVNSYVSCTVGKPIGLVSRITMDSHWHRGPTASAPRAMQGVVSSADMDVVLPNGSSVDVQMHDDGLHHDLAANDGIFGATITADEPGSYIAQAFIRGVVNGSEFVRSTQQIITVVDDFIDFNGQAKAVADGQQRMRISVGVTAPANCSYRAYAEVWGSGSDGSPTLVPVAWIAGIVNVVADSDVGGWSVPLELDLQWAARANATAPFTLRNVLLQDVVAFMPVAEFLEVPVAISGDVGDMKQTLYKLIQKPQIATEITDEMRWGVRPARFARRSSSVASRESVPLVMSHGYCAGRNPWQVNQQDFPNAYFFQDFKANRPHDEFARMIAAFADQHNLTSWAGVAHSQGGVALLHLHNYYWSGLEVPTEGRRLQSVGSPYQGCTAAGTAAGVGKVFGVGCGKNPDFALDGAKLWYAGISAAAEADVYYYTTTYKQGSTLGDYCSLAMNLVLEWPNDGTAELVYAQLANGNYMGNTEGECHTEGMKYDPQYVDQGRNKVINDNRGY